LTQVGGPTQEGTPWLWYSIAICTAWLLGLASREAELRLPERVPGASPVQGVPGAGGTLSVLGLVAFMSR